MEDGVVAEVPNVLRVFTHTIDGKKWFCASIFNSKIAGEDWKKIKTQIEYFLKVIYEKKIKYHFLFDIHEIPLERIASFQRLMTKNQHILNACLYSTAIITQNIILHAAMKLALQLYTPVRPIKFFYKEQTDTIKSEECPAIPKHSMKKIKEYFEETQKSNVST